LNSLAGGVGKEIVNQRLIRSLQNCKRKSEVFTLIPDLIEKSLNSYTESRSLERFSETTHSQTLEPLTTGISSTHSDINTESDETPQEVTDLPSVLLEKQNSWMPELNENDPRNEVDHDTRFTSNNLLLNSRFKRRTINLGVLKEDVTQMRASHLDSIKEQCKDFLRNESKEISFSGIHEETRSHLEIELESTAETKFSKVLFDKNQCKAFLKTLELDQKARKFTVAENITFFDIGLPNLMAYGCKLNADYAYCQVILFPKDLEMNPPELNGHPSLDFKRLLAKSREESVEFRPCEKTLRTYSEVGQF
jgi:hypothetical protein